MSMSISGAQPVGIPGGMPPAPTISADQTAQTASTSATSSTQTATRVDTMTSRVESSEMQAFQELTALALQGWILEMLLGQNKEDSGNTMDKFMTAMALMGMMSDRPDPRGGVFVSSMYQETTEMSVVATQEAVTAYTTNQQQHATAADPGSQNTAVNAVDTAA